MADNYFNSGYGNDYDAYNDRRDRSRDKYHYADRSDYDRFPGIRRSYSYSDRHYPPKRWTPSESGDGFYNKYPTYDDSSYSDYGNGRNAGKYAPRFLPNLSRYADRLKRSSSSKRLTRGRRDHGERQRAYIIGTLVFLGALIIIGLALGLGLGLGLNDGKSGI